MAIDLSELIHDADFNTTFKVKKVIGTYWERGIATEKRSSLTVTGIVLPASPHDLEMLPEGDRVKGAKTFVTDAIPLEIGNTHRTADICEWGGRDYKIISAWDYSIGSYYKALGTLVSEDNNAKLQGDV